MTDGTGRKTLFHGGVLSAFGERDYAVLWSGAFISNIGTWVQTAALLWLVKNVWQSNSWVGAVNMANFAPVLLLVPFSGSLADRYNRRKLILAGQVVMMLGAFALAIAASAGLASNKAVVMVAVAVIGVAFAFNFPAWQAMLPDLVRREDLLNAISLSSAQWNLARFVGPVIGGVLLTYFTYSTAFYANAVSFLFVIAALLVIHPKRGVMARSTKPLFSHVWEGWRYVGRQRWMVNALIAMGVVSAFGFSYIVLIPAVVKDELGRGAGAYSLVLGMTGLGAVIGAPLLTLLSRRFKESNIIKVSILALGLLLLAFAVSRTYWLTCVISTGLGCSFLVTGSAINSVLQGCSTREMRGRVVSLYIMVFVGIFPLGGQLLAYISDVRSTPFSLILGGLVCMGVASVLIIFPGLIRGAVLKECEEPIPVA
ncbi:MAG: MFS transporter [Actinomycetota bacterium]